MRVARVHARTLHVSAKTNWSFVRLEADDGTLGFGEASLNGAEPAIGAALDALAQRCSGATFDAARATAVVRADATLPENAAASALQQALLDAAARRDGVPAHARLGPLRRERVALYANINRATADRTPAGFAATARRARAQGYTAFKAAPFDGLTPALCDTDDGRARIRHGIDCLAALRDAVGPDLRLMVDCHWRFTEAAALDALRALRPLALHWFECPLAEVRANDDALRRVRHAANAQGVLVAAAETQVGVDAFQALFDARLYDVVMPDVKYCGGPQEMLRIAERAQAAGVQFSPHNPTGPVCTAHSLQVAGVAPACELLEIQFDESALYAELIGGALAPEPDGTLAIPAGPGIGVAPRQAVFDAHPYRPVPPGIELQPPG
jgi:galactonate dehydratase